MGDFKFYFSTGWEHIISWDALDHLLFILVLSSIYLIKNWRQVLVLVTAFTIGHSLTLALAVYEIIRIPDKWVEFLIPCTIVCTAVFNLAQREYDAKNLRFNYLMALVFGLIHGMGFANTIRFMMAKDQQIGWSLFGFNIGLEAGQVVVVIIILLISLLFVTKLNVFLNLFWNTKFAIKRKWWVWSINIFSFYIAFRMMMDRWPF
ncbi:MAG: HupE/UreJ family protein [Chitinophagaceae bacterium]